MYKRVWCVEHQGSVCIDRSERPELHQTLDPQARPVHLQMEMKVQWLMRVAVELEQSNDSKR